MRENRPGPGPLLAFGAADVMVGMAVVAAVAGCGASQMAAGRTAAEAHNAELTRYVASLSRLSECITVLEYRRELLRDLAELPLPRGPIITESYPDEEFARLSQDRRKAAYEAPTEARIFAWGDSETWRLIETLADRERKMIRRASQRRLAEERERLEAEEAGRKVEQKKKARKILEARRRAAAKAGPTAPPPEETPDVEVEPAP